MADRLMRMVEAIRESQGSFFVARLLLQMKEPITRPETPDREELIEALFDACRKLDMAEQDLARLRRLW